MGIDSNDILGFRGLTQTDMFILEKWYGMTHYFGYATGFKDFSDIRNRLMAPSPGSCKLASMVCIGEDKTPIGFVYGEVKNVDKKTVFWIHILIIEPSYQNKGFGTRAVNRLTERLHKQYGPMTCIVAVSGKNKQGLSFWKQIGFVHSVGMEESLQQFGTSDIAILKKSVK